MSRIEVLGYPQTADQLQQAMRLLGYFDEIPLHEPVVQWTITLRQQYRIRLPDALIAATALHLGFPLVTQNTQDFQIINGLIILNSFERLLDRLKTLDRLKAVEIRYPRCARQLRSSCAASQAQRIRHHRHRAERHGRTSQHRIEHDPDEWIPQSLPPCARYPR
jgi:predicted nucleic acid-binding protein